MEKKAKERVYYLDYLRVLAMFSVMIGHSACRYWETVDVNSRSFVELNIYQALLRWAVPVFVMISGALFLNRNIALSKLYSKYILRMVTAFVVWTVFYAIVSKEGAYSFPFNLLYGHYHMWYIYMCIFLYMVSPLLNKLICNYKWVKIFLISVVTICFLGTQAIVMFGDFISRDIAESTIAWKILYSRVGSSVDILGYLFYFVLGYHLNTVEIKKPVRIVMYVLGILGGISTFWLDQIMTINTQVACSTYYNAVTINILLQSAAIFIFFKNIDFKKNAFISKLAQYTFGAYLVHAFFIELLDRCYHINGFIVDAFVGCFFVGVLVMFLSYLVSFALNNMPVINKYIV